MLEHKQLSKPKYPISQICKLFKDNPQALLDHFNIPYTSSGHRLSFACPIHGGDNPTGCTLYYDDIPNWICWTHDCHTKYGKSIFNFIQKLLNTDIKGTYEFCLAFLGLSDADVQNFVIEYKKNTKFDKVFNTFYPEIMEKESIIDRETILSSLDIPSNYFISRGFCKDTLVKFDVGDCLKENKLMFNRAVVPVYNEYSECIGCTGRDITNQSPKKWLNSKNFKKSHYLYGLNFAKEKIVKSNICIIVEGPGDVWRLHESGFENCVAIMGSNLSQQQLIQLEKSGCLYLIVLTDNDEAGEKAFNQIKSIAKRRFVYFRPQFNAKDIGDESISNIQEVIGNIYDKNSMFCR